MVGCEAGVHVLQQEQTSREQDGADEQHNRQPDLGGHQQLAHPRGVPRGQLGPLRQPVGARGCQRRHAGRRRSGRPAPSAAANSRTARSVCSVANSGNAGRSRGEQRAPASPAPSRRRALSPRATGQALRSRAGGPAGRGPAPSARRTANSRARPTPRPSCSLAMLAQTIRNSRPTAPRQQQDGRPRVGRHDAVQRLDPDAHLGVGVRIRPARDPPRSQASWSRACASETPGLSLATMFIQCARRIWTKTSGLYAERRPELRVCGSGTRTRAA